MGTNAHILTTLEKLVLTVVCVLLVVVAINGFFIHKSQTLSRIYTLANQPKIVTIPLYPLRDSSTPLRDAFRLCIKMTEVDPTLDCIVDLSDTTEFSTSTTTFKVKVDKNDLLTVQ